MRQNVKADAAAFDRLKVSISRYGLIQPIVLDFNNNLIAGGRRYAACVELGMEEISVVYKDTPEGDVSLRECELEENTQRSEMPWQDRVRSIGEIHRSRSRTAAQDGDRWPMQLTGELLGLSLASVGYALQLEKLIRAGDKDILACPSMTQALDLMIQRRHDEAAKRLATRIKEQAQRVHKVATVPGPTVEGAHEPSVLPDEPPPPQINLTTTVLNIDALDLLDQIDVVDHIITDPPYGIDMDMLEQEGTGMDVSRVVDTHDVEENLGLLKQFIEMASTKFRGFMVLWCDQVNWQFLYYLGTDCGLAVQRWPITWIKPSAMNQAAQYNTTKNTEIAIVMRQKGAQLPRPVPVSTITAPTLFTKDHPFAKPPTVWHFLYSSFCREGDTVLDPFAGTGSAPLAALDKGLRPICGEVEEHHYNPLLIKMQQKYRALLGDDVQFT